MRKFIFHNLVILATFLGLTSSLVAANFDDIVTKNIFSPSRQYVPYITNQKPKDVKKDFLTKYLILRGTLIKENERLAVIEVLPAAKRELGLETNTRRVVVGQGETLGNCQVLKVLPGEVILGGRCEDITLSLKESPERKKPFFHVKRPERNVQTPYKKQPPRPPHRLPHETKRTEKVKKIIPKPKR
ncbi:hypothetical protein [Thermodesulfatator indicus]